MNLYYFHPKPIYKKAEVLCLFLYNTKEKKKEKKSQNSEFFYISTYKKIICTRWSKPPGHYLRTACAINLKQKVGPPFEVSSFSGKYLEPSETTAPKGVFLGACAFLTNFKWNA